jgi:DNA-binding PadR family transcriptional regulator
MNASLEDALPLNPKTFLLLLVLADEGPQHGYAIKTTMHARSGGTVDMDAGGFYRLVGRLERDGYLRQYLAITRLGRAVVAAESRRIASLARLPAVQALAREAP